MKAENSEFKEDMKAENSKFKEDIQNDFHEIQNDFRDIKNNHLKHIEEDLLEIKNSQLWLTRVGTGIIFVLAGLFLKSLFGGL